MCACLTPEQAGEREDSLGFRVQGLGFRVQGYLKEPRPGDFGCVGFRV